MKSNRRKFLRNITIGTGAFTISLPSFAKPDSYQLKKNEVDNIEFEELKNQFDPDGKFTNDFISKIF